MIRGQIVLLFLDSQDGKPTDSGSGHLDLRSAIHGRSVDELPQRPLQFVYLLLLNKVLETVELLQDGGGVASAGDAAQKFFVAVTDSSLCVPQDQKHPISSQTLF
ncbi:hypothetical protein EYF80_006625 [Liparis tanakae]|uniref:Uncharacterized protein n=1 Tax=Liparis tanakae TaxID=230148 RepID=A0A4Z2J009_9TELE|nr:hypothetical protein EYF80_006625 [Liparis tanakae]